MLRDSNERRSMGLDRLRHRTMSAVPKSPPAQDVAIAVVTSAKFSLMSFLRLYIWQAREMTAGPRRKRRMSPAPNDVGDIFPIL